MLFKQDLNTDEAYIASIDKSRIHIAIKSATYIANMHMMLQANYN